MTSRGRYVGQLGVQDGQLESILGSILAHMSRLGTNFKENDEKSKNVEKPKVFKSFWVVSGFHLEAFGGHVGLGWRILAPR